MGICLDARPVGQPGGQAEHEPGRCAEDAHQHPVGPDDETDVPGGGALGGQQPQRSQAALRQYREAADPHQGDEQHADGGQGEHDRLWVQNVARGRRVRRGDVQPDAVRGDAERVEQDNDLTRRSDLARDDEGELVHQILRVLHDASDPPGGAAGAPEVTDREMEGGCHPAGDRHLGRAGRVVPADQGEHRLAIRAARVLRAQVEGVDGAGDRDGLVLDDVHPAEAVLQGGDLTGQVGVRGLERGLVLGGTEPCVGRRGRGGGHRRPHDGGRYRDRDEPQDQ